MFLAELTVLLLIRTVWRKKSENSYLRGFCAQVSQLVFLADLTFFRLLLRYEQKCEDSYLREFCAQVLQIVCLADLTVLRIITTVWEKNFTKLISPLVLCTSLPNRVLSWFDRFTSYYNCMKENVTKLISARVLCTSVTNRVHCWFDHLRLNTTVWAKMSPNSYLCKLCAQVSQNVFLADLTVLRLNTTVWAKMSKISYLHHLCAQLS